MQCRLRTHEEGEKYPCSVVQRPLTEQDCAQGAALQSRCQAHAATEGLLANASSALAELAGERDGLLCQLEAKRAALSECEALLQAAQDSHMQAQADAAAQKEAADKVRKAVMPGT